MRELHVQLSCIGKLALVQFGPSIIAFCGIILRKCASSKINSVLGHFEPDLADLLRFVMILVMLLNILP